MGATPPSIIQFTFLRKKNEQRKKRKVFFVEVVGKVLHLIRQTLGTSQANATDAVGVQYW